MRSLEVRVVARTGSTNDDLKAQARNASVRIPVVLETKCQTQGRGTRGRVWKASSGALTFSLMLPVRSIAVPMTLGPIAVGIGVCQALRTQGLRVGLKWPNDLWFKGGKCGGILCEIVKDSDGEPVLIIGVGLNRKGSNELTTQGWPITGFESLAPFISEGVETPDPLLMPIVRDVLKLLLCEKTVIVSEWPLYDAFSGCEILLKTEDGAFKGRNLGIDCTGRLLMAFKNGEKAFFSGTISNDNPSD